MATLIHSWASRVLYFALRRSNNIAWSMKKCLVTMKFLPSHISWIWCKCLQSNFINSKIFQSDRIQRGIFKKNHSSLRICERRQIKKYWGQFNKNCTCKSFIKLTPGCGNDSTYSFFKQIDSLINGIYRGKLDLYNIARTPAGLQPHLLVPRVKVQGLKTDVNSWEHSFEKKFWPNC